MDKIHSKWRKPKRKLRSSLKKAHEAKARKKAVETTSTRIPSPPPPNLVMNEEETQEPASVKKIDKLNIPVQTSDEEYVIVNTKCFQEIVDKFECPCCKTKSLTATMTNMNGFAGKVTIKCSSCDELHSKVDTSPRVKDDISQRPPFLVNRNATSAFLDIGGGHAAMARFGASLGMRVLDSTSFQSHLRKLTEEAEILRKQMLDYSRSVVRKAHEEINPNLVGKEVIDITVSIDGSWHKRGHLSLFGFVAVIDILTGLVVDYIVLSKFCLACSLATHELGEDSEDFDEWKRKHEEDGGCCQNYEGSSGGMEAGGAVMLFKRSVAEVKMMYTSFLSDGDSKTLSELNKAQPYGPDVTITKEECINHLSKRMGTAVRNMVKDSKKLGLKLGGRGEGTLTEKSIIVLQSYYHSAIIKNVPDIEKMRRAILSTLYHCSSTDDKPNHSYCPPGPESWCFFNKSEGKDEQRKSHDSMRLKLNQAAFKALLPHYERLSSDELLSRCSRAGTQNANESLHSKIWKKCPKHIFISKQRMDYGITQGVAEYNMGCSAVQALRSEIARQAAPRVSLEIAKRKDLKRKAQSQHQHEADTKRARAQKKSSKRGKTSKNPLYAAGAGD